MKKILCTAIMLCSIIHIYGQQDTLEKSLDEVIIYSNKFAERKKNVTQKIDIITARQIALMNAQNTGDLLINTGNIFVQKSQQGGSSPIIRGFEASRVLLVIDGIRMNNAIYRAGHLQNVITIDQNMLERIEVLYGPASTLYGSDALGGVVHMRTKVPKLSLTNKTTKSGSVFARHSTANKEKTMHADLSIGGKKWGWLQSYNYSNFNDLKMGSHYPDSYPNFGRRPKYITTINGVDSIVTNEDDRVQKFSGYSQWDITQKILFNQSNKVSHLLNLQYSSSSNIPRYDRLQDIRNGLLRYAQWYYGPQTRTLAAYEISVKQLGFFDQFKAIVAHQYIEESRNQREYRRYDRLDIRQEALQVMSYTVDGKKTWNQHEITIGTDGQLNKLKSTAYRKNILTNGRSPLDSRYPNGDNRMNYFGMYAQHIWKWRNEKFVINDGLRLQYVRLYSSIEDNSFLKLPFTDLKQNNSAATGNLGIIYFPSPNTRLSLSGATGFRAPNIDDLARIFESNTASRQLIIPNPNIKPEYTYNVDFAVNQSIAQIVKLEATGYYTQFRNAIALAPDQLNGKDSVNYNGLVSKVFSNQNVNRADLYGFNAAVTLDLTRQLRFLSTINYTQGRYKKEDKNEVPLDHIPPVFGKTSITYTHSKLKVDIYALYNGWKRISDYNINGEDNVQYATKDGTPPWTNFNIKTSLNLVKNLSLQLGIENIADRNYRYFASGFSAPGRNFIMAIRGTF